MDEYKKIFQLAAKVGCLEGYMYKRNNVEPQYLPNWVGNIERMYGELPAEAKQAFKEDYLTVMKNILEHMEQVPGKEDKNTLKVKGMIEQIG